MKIEAYAKYFNPQVTASNLSGFAAALTGAFGVTAASTGEALKTFTALNNVGGIVAGGGGNNNQSGFPKLFVNILLFDRNYNLVDAAWQQIDGGEQPVGNGTKLPHDYMSAEMTAKEAGFAYLYFSNENASLIEFYIDDVTMSYTPGNVIQYNEFYNHGLQTANSWTRDNTTGNNYLANGGTEFNATSSLYDLDYRNYDPVLGRMNQVDPLASKFASHTPYNYAFNDPVFFNDPSGAAPLPGEPDFVGWRRPETYGVYFAGNMNLNNGGGTMGGFTSLYDMIWAGGFGNIGGIALGNQSMYDYYSMGNDQYVEKYSEKVYQSGSSHALSETSLWSPWGGDEIRPGKYSGAWTSFNMGLLASIVFHNYQIRTSTSNYGCPTCLDPSTVGKNAGLTYPGPNNPMTYPDENGKRRPDYTTVPKYLSEYPAIGHDRRYDNLKISGFWGLVSDTRAIGADWQFVKEEYELALTAYYDPVTRMQGAFFGTILGGLALGKTVVEIMKGPQGGIETIMWYNYSNSGVTNIPTKTGK